MTLIVLIALPLVGLSAALFARVVAFPRLQVLARIDEISSYGLVEHEPAALGQAQKGNPVSRAAAVVGGLVANRSEKINLEPMHKMLIAAGYYRTRPETFLGYQILAVLGAGSYGFLLSGGGAKGVMLALILGASGAIIPRFFVMRKGKRRSERIEDELPDLIDLLVVTVEAGLSLSSSLSTASRRMTGPLGDELRLAMQEQRMGLPVADILQNMLRRSETPSMRSFVRSLVQGETLGVSIGTIMRNLAHEMRGRRKSRAEERANKAPVKMLFPLIFLIFPALFIVLLGPAMLEIMDALGSL